MKDVTKARVKESEFYSLSKRGKGPDTIGSFGPVG
jgi:hypothetical protein